MSLSIINTGAALLCLLGAMAMCVPNAQAQAAPKPLPEGVSLLPADSLSAFKVPADKTKVVAETVNVAGQPFASALRVRVLVKTDSPYGLQMGTTTTAPVKKGDVVLFTFYARSIEGLQPETGEAKSEFVFERGGPPHTKSVTYSVAIPKGEWKRFDVPFVIAEDADVGSPRMQFRLGYGPQVFEIGGFKATNFGKSVTVRDLPRTPTTYPGREANAAWRKEAEARIEKIRKGDLAVVVNDRNGKAVPGAQVSVRMTRHAFPFGSAVAADMLLRDDADGQKYREMTKKLFNRVVMENDLKWPNWEGNRERAIKGVAWLREQGIEVRGHNLVWPNWRWLPRDLEGLKGDKEALAKRIRDHIADEAGTMKGQLVEWDVVNEPFANHALQDILGNEALVEWFKLAKATDPKPRLFLNDYPPLDGDAKNNEHLAHFEKTLQYLIDSGAPLEGIGFQCHIGGTVIPPARIVSGLDRFAKLNRPIAITEFDINTLDDPLQADYMRDFLTAAFSHPSVDSVIMWGFWEGRHWIPAAALWNRDWSIKPSGQAWVDMVQNKWWTKAEGKTSRTGAFATRGFLGDYEVTVTAGGKTKTIPATLSAGGAKLTVTLD